MTQFFLTGLAGKVTPLTAPRFVDCLHKTPPVFAGNLKQFSVHSFRRGGAHAATKGDAIKIQGNWRSDCYQNNVSRDGLLRSEFSTAMAAGCHQPFVFSVVKRSLNPEPNEVILIRNSLQDGHLSATLEW